MSKYGHVKPMGNTGTLKFRGRNQWEPTAVPAQGAKATRKDVATLKAIDARLATSKPELSKGHEDHTNGIP